MSDMEQQLQDLKTELLATKSAAKKLEARAAVAEALIEILYRVHSNGLHDPMQEWKAIGKDSSIDATEYLRRMESEIMPAFRLDT